MENRVKKPLSGQTSEKIKLDIGFLQKRKCEYMFFSQI